MKPRPPNNSRPTPQWEGNQSPPIFLEARDEEAYYYYLEERYNQAQDLIYNEDELLNTQRVE